MIDAYFDAVDDGLRPDPWARAPWAADMLHGRLIGGLAARAIEAEAVEPAWRVARLTVDLFRPSAMEPVTVEVRPVRTGRRLRVVDATVRCDGHEVARVTAVILPESEEPPGNVWAPEPEPWPDPDQLPPPPRADDDADDADGDSAGDARSPEAWIVREVAGGFGTAERSRLWTNDTAQLVAGEPMSPLVRAAVSGDLACPIANSSDQGIHFINADYTMLLARYPVGPWIGLEVAQRLSADGIAIASATLVDRDGPFATSSGASLARPPLPD